MAKDMLVRLNQNQNQCQVTSYREREYFTSHHPNNRPIKRNINTSCAGDRDQVHVSTG